MKPERQMQDRENDARLNGETRTRRKYSCLNYFSDGPRGGRMGEGGRKAPGGGIEKIKPLIVGCFDCTGF